MNLFILCWEVDSGIERALGMLVEFLGTDRSTMFEFSPDATTLHATHSWARPDVTPLGSDMLNRENNQLVMQVFNSDSVRAPTTATKTAWTAPCPSPCAASVA